MGKPTNLTQALANFSAALDAFKAGARHSKTDQAHLDQAAQHLAAAGASIKPPKAGAPGAKAIPAGTDPGDYAMSEGWDVATAANVLAQIAQLAVSELSEEDEDGVTTLIANMRSLVDFINGEIAGMEEGLAADVTEDSTEDVGMFSGKALTLGVQAIALRQAGAIKTAGDWELDVLAIPYGGPNAGKDSQGEYFSPSTQLHEDNYPNPMVVYYHGYDENGRPQGEPENVGAITKRWTDAKGRWVRVALDKASAYARRIWDAAQKKQARASSGSISHLVRRAADGLLTHWPFAELSLFDAVGKRQPANAYAVALPVMKSHYQRAGIAMPAFDASPEAPAAGPSGKVGAANGVPTTQHSKELTEMDETQIAKLVADSVATALKAQQDAAAAEAQRVAQEQTRIDAAVKMERTKWEAEAAKSRRLPMGGQAPYQGRFGFASKYDNLEARDLSLLIDILTPNFHNSERKDYQRAPFEAIKALALRLESEEVTRGQSELFTGKVDNAALYNEAVQAFKAVGIKAADLTTWDQLAAKANELDNSAQSGFGSDWIGTAYSTNLWNVIRQDPAVGSRMMASAIEIPQGYSSIYLPLEGADPTWYKVAETTGTNATTGLPDSTITASKVATANKQLTVGKMGARVIWSGEMDEDSFIPFAANLRRQLEISGLEQFTHLCIDGDTATGATTNINHIGGTPTSTDLYLVFNGFRKSPLVTTTALSRNGNGSLVAEDYINTAKLAGPAGMNFLDKTKVSFIVDVNTYWKTLTLPEVKTRDVFVQPTIENGDLTGIYGYELLKSAFMHFKDTNRKANTAGKVDQTTPANNTTGAIVAVRWDQWQLGFKRHVSIETQRIPAADSTQIVAIMRTGMVQRDTNASAETYNVGV